MFRFFGFEPHYPELVAAREAAGRPLPRYVREEFEAYLECGRLEQGHSSHKAVGNRFLGYRDGLARSGLKFDPALVEKGDNSFSAGEAAGARLLGHEDPPTAIFAANDDMAAGVIRAASLLGVNVPGEVSVAGCDDVSLASMLRPTLTTIRQPLADMAERAARALIDAAHTRSMPQGAQVVPASIRIRESTGPAPVRRTQARGAAGPSRRR